MTESTARQVEEIVAVHAGLEGPLLPILHAVQAAFGCVPREAVPVIAHALNLSRAEVYGVVSFYHDFREQLAGQRVVKLCRAEACQAMGGAALAAKALKHFGINWGETSADGRVTIEPIYCLGLCSVAPAALVDGEPHGRLAEERLIALVERST
jgi:formate dehydrogenase subunit gamma